MEPELAAQALRIIQSLYKQKSIIRDLALKGDDKKSHRQKQAKPIVDEFFKWTCHRSCKTDPQTIIEN